MYVDLSIILLCILNVFSYLIGQAVGGVLFPPYSESFGRKKLYIIATFFFSFFCVLIAAVPSIATVIVGRFSTGVLSAIPSIILAGSIEDMFNSGPRIWMIYLWSIAANLGFCIGPIVGAYVTTELNWYTSHLEISNSIADLIGGGTFT